MNIQLVVQALSQALCLRNGFDVFVFGKHFPTDKCNCCYFQKIAGPWSSWRDQITRNVRLNISPFHFFELFSELLQSESTQASISEQFFDFELQSTQTWTRIRTTFRARVRIRTIIRARAIVTDEKCAREAASLGATRHGSRDYFSSVGGGPFF